jgi:SAM-dependent methyltransferase
MSDRAALRERIVPAAMKARVDVLAESDIRLKTLRYILGEPKIYEWAHSIGTSSDPVLASMVPPIPPRELRLLVAESETELFLWTGVLDLNLVLSAWEMHGPKVADRKPAILDFGCGCGRLLRFLVPCTDVAEIHGAEVNPDLVAWCKANLPGVNTVATKPEPPLPHGDASFDLIYSLSVLTHLPEDAIGPWLEELARVMRPGGILLATTHGPLALKRIERESELQRVTGLDSARASGILRDLPGANVRHLPYDSAQTERTRAGPRYGTTFLSERHIRALGAASGFEVLEVVAGGMRGWQDVVVARRVPGIRATPGSRRRMVKA